MIFYPVYKGILPIIITFLCSINSLVSSIQFYHLVELNRFTQFYPAAMGFTKMHITCLAFDYYSSLTIKFTLKTYMEKLHADLCLRRIHRLEESSLLCELLKLSRLLWQRSRFIFFASGLIFLQWRICWCPFWLPLSLCC